MVNKVFVTIKQVVSLLLAMVLLASVVVVPVPVQAEDEPGYGQKTIMVSLGDSFSSGEGIEPFYDQELPLGEKVNSQDWLAHRSKNCWSGMLTLPGVRGTMSRNRDSVWYFVASSGAETKHLKSKQKKEYDKDAGWFEDYQGVDYIDPQLDVFSKIPEGETDYVTMTIGGNDADFVGIIKKAVVGTAYFDISGLKKALDKKREQLKEGGSLRKSIVDSYGDVEEKAGKQANILVAGYPCLLDPDGGGTMTSKEAKEINSAVSDFNDAIEEFVSICRDKGMNIHFVDVEEEFRGHGAYADDPYLNGVILTQQSEDLKDHDLLGASSYSMHPNFKGACAYARCVQAKIDQIENSKIQYKTTFDLSVRDYKGNLCSDYRVNIEGKTKGFVFGLFSNDYSDSFTVSSAEPVSVKVPKGDYTVTISCDGVSYSTAIKVTASGKKNKLVINTNIGFDPTWGGEVEDWYDKPDRVTSDERDVVLVLDVSGSMAGEPMEQTKRAARNFIDTVLQQDASIGIVTYDNYAHMVSDFTIDGQYLKSCVDRLYDGGGTNIDAGLSVAQEMLRQSNAQKKIIVLMSDGLPNEGREGQQLIEFSDDIKNENVLIYTLGFFGLVDDKSQPQALMEGIASEGCHYEVDDADNLVFFFEDMADQINGTRYIYIRIACPVEVTVTHNGETLTSDGQTKSQRTDFGTLTFEQGADGSTDEKSRVKILRLKEGESYSVQINGTGRGIMNYTIGFMDEDGQYSDMREFRNIKINKNTIIDTVADTGRTTTLKVDEDGDGRYDIRYRAGENERAEEVNDLWIYIVVAAAALVVATVVIMLKAKKNKKSKKKTEEEGN